MKPELEKLARHRLARAKEAFAEGENLLTNTIVEKLSREKCQEPFLFPLKITLPGWSFYACVPPSGQLGLGSVWREEWGGQVCSDPDKGETP